MYENRRKISIVIPSFNSQSTVQACLASIYEQTYPANLTEVIVADNGSVDGTREFIEARFPQVVVLHVSQKGSGHARNAGFLKAQGELILSTDADCICEPTWAAELVEAFGRAPEGTAAIGGLILPYRVDSLAEKYEKCWVSQPAALTPDAKVRYTATPNAAFSRGPFASVGGFDGALAFDDTDLGLRLQAAGYQISFTDRAVVRHRNPATLRELYLHRRKYGQANFALACKYPEIFGDPHGPQERSRILQETIKRVCSNICKLPFSLVRERNGRPRSWPIVDAVMAVASCAGFFKSSHQADLQRR